MGTERKIEALKEATDRKRQEALDKTNQAIARLLKEGKRINFHTVAEAAGVSVTYLYKYDELKERINYLRKQQEQPSNKPISPQPASDKSKSVIITQLKERIKKLEVENRGLRDQIEAIYGRLSYFQSAQQEVEAFKNENVSLKIEIDCLKQQLGESNKNYAAHQPAPAQPLTSKVTSLVDKKTERSGVSDKIKSELASLEIKLNSTLTKTIESASESIVLSAIEALKEAMANGVIERPGGWLNAAIKDGWIPNEKHLPQDKTEREIFKEWFDLAYKQRLVLASTKGAGGQMYVYTVDGVQLPFEEMLVEHPLETLRASL